MSILGLIGFRQKGNFNNIKRFLNRMKESDYRQLMEVYGLRGVEILMDATPKDTGLTAASWDYEIREENGRQEIIWTNSNLGEGWFPIALYIQYGHATKNGAWVEGVDYINPALKDMFDQLAEDIWKEVKRS